MLVRLLPDLLTLLDVVWGVDRIVDADHHNQGPGEGHKDAVEVQRMRVMGFAASEGVIISGHDGGDEREPRE